MLMIFFVVLLSVSTLPASADDLPTAFIFDGSGFGHGVGLSQIGAKAQATLGKTAPEILSYYYPGTQVSPINDAADIRVNVGHRLSTATIGIDKTLPNGTFKVLRSNGVVLGEGFNKSISAKFSVVGKLARVTISGKGLTPAISATDPSFTVLWTGSRALSGAPTAVVFNSGASSVRLRYGQLQVSAVPVTGNGYFLEASASLRLHDEYLYGISEVPSSWPVEAMKSQVIASRTYAIARMGKIKKECDCQIYNSKYDQNYIGYAKEVEPKYGKLWKLAVDATAATATTGLVVIYKNKPINVYFFSSSGGMTQRSEDVWGTSFPYLVNVLDPWSVDPTYNPSYAYWERVISQEDLAIAFQLPSINRIEIATRSVSNSVLTVQAFSPEGLTSTLSVAEIKAAVKLPSSWFEIIPDQPSPSPSLSPTASPSPTDTGSPTPAPTVISTPTPSAN